MTDTPFHYQQSYKSRAEALEKLIHAKKWPVAQGKFYPDMLKEGLLQPDKSLHLADLLNYVERRLKIDPVTGQSLVNFDHEKEIRELDLQERRLKVGKLRKENEKAEGNLIEIQSAEQAMARKIVVIYEKIKAQVRRDQEESLLRLGLPPAKAAAFVAEVIGSVDRAFNEMRSRKTFDIMIRGEDDRTAAV